MIFRNFTPFPHLNFESQDPQGRPFGVVVVRATFDILRQAPLCPADIQDPLVEADQYHGEPGKSSLRMESDLAPFKPRSDIHFHAVAHAPALKPMSTWRVILEVGAIKTSLQVTGPRGWRFHQAFGWQLSEPLPCVQVPLRYEYAYGGLWKSGSTEQAFEENPVGCGYVRTEEADRTQEYAAPQLTGMGEDTLRFGTRVTPVGVGPVARAWMPRRGLAGTFDRAWLESRWPALPGDFDFAHYNSAHPSLTYPGFLKGDERIRLGGMDPDGELELRLPGYQLALLLRFKDGSIAPAALNLDTCFLDIVERKAWCTWRACFGLGKVIRALEVRMNTAGRAAHG